MLVNTAIKNDFLSCLKEQFQKINNVAKCVALHATCCKEDERKDELSKVFKYIRSLRN